MKERIAEEKPLRKMRWMRNQNHSAGTSMPARKNSSNPHKLAHRAGEEKKWINAGDILGWVTSA